MREKEIRKENKLEKREKNKTYHHQIIICYLESTNGGGKRYLEKALAGRE